MKYSIFSSTAPAMPKPSKGTEFCKLLLSQASKNMHAPPVSELFSVLCAKKQRRKNSVSGPQLEGTLWPNGQSGGWFGVISLLEKFDGVYCRVCSELSMCLDRANGSFAPSFRCVWTEQTGRLLRVLDTFRPSFRIKSFGLSIRLLGLNFVRCLSTYDRLACFRYYLTMTFVPPMMFTPRWRVSRRWPCRL